MRASAILQATMWTALAVYDLIKLVSPRDEIRPKSKYWRDGIGTLTFLSFPPQKRIVVFVLSCRSYLPFFQIKEERRKALQKMPVRN